MVEGKKKSRTLRRVYKKTPGGKTKLTHQDRKPGKAQCADCGAYLKGVPREKTSKIKNMPKTKKRPDRPYGGKLCSKCMRKRIIQKTKEVSKQ